MSHNTSRNLNRIFIFAIGLAGLLGGASVPAAPPVNTLKSGLFSNRANVAILGYDTVAYFTEGRPVKGKPDFAFDWMGATWQFSSQTHLTLFRADPAKYAPQYGGYCAYGVSQDNLVGIEPDKFRVLDGKLYLNYNAEVQAIWVRNPAGYIRQADAKFKALLQR